MQTQSSQKDTGTFYSYTSLYNYLNNAISLQSADLFTFLEKPENKEKFIKPFVELFPPKEANIGETWSKKEITVFKAANVQINVDIQDLMRRIAETCNMSIIRVYEYLEEQLRMNPQLARILQKPEFIKSGGNSIEERLIDMWLSERIHYLKSLYIISGYRSSHYSDQINCVLISFLDSLISGHGFAKKLVDDYEEVGKTKSLYFSKHPSYHVIYKLKEELSLVKSMLAVFSLNANKFNFKDISGRVAELFLRQKLSGSLPSLLLENTVSFSDVNDSAKELVEQIYTQNSLILICFNETSPIVSAFRKVNIEEEEGSIFVKFATAATLFEIVLRGLNDPQTVIDSSIYKRFDFPEYLMDLLKKLKKLHCLNDPGVATVLTRVVISISTIQEDNLEILTNFFPEENIKQNAILYMLKLIFANEAHLLNYWSKDLNSNMNLDLIIQQNLAMFPYDTETLIRTANIIIGSNGGGFAQETTELLMNLPYVTVETYRSVDLIVGKETGGEFDLALPVALETPEDLVLPVGTPAYSLGGNLIRCRHKFNFLAYLLRGVETWLRAVREKPRAPLVPECVQYFKLFAKLITVNAHNVTGFQAQALSREEEQPTMLIMMLLEAQRVLRQAPENARLLVKFNEALEALLLTDHARLTRALISAQPSYTEMRGSALGSLQFYQLAEEEPEKFRIRTKDHLNALISGLRVSAILLSDVEFVVSHLAGTGGRAAEEGRTEVSAMASGVVGTCDFLVRTGELAACARGFIDANWNSGVLQDFVEATLVPLSRRILKDDFDVLYECQGLKYRMFTTVLRNIQVLLEHAKSAKGANFTGLPCVGRRVLDLVGRVPVSELVLDCLHPRFNIDMLTQGRISGIENRHYVEHVRQKKNRVAERDIIAFIVAALELGTELLNAAIRHHADSPNFLRTVESLFGQKDGIHNYVFSTMDATYRINVVLAILSLLEMRDLGSDFPNPFALEHFEFATLNRSEDLFMDLGDIEQQQIIAGYDRHLIFGRVLSKPTVISRPQHLSEAIFVTLGAVLDLWSIQERIHRPNLVDIIGPAFNELPQTTANAPALLTCVLFKLFFSIINPTPAVMDFLLQLTVSQPALVDELCRYKDDSGEPMILTALVSSFSRYQEPEIVYRLLRLATALLSWTRSRRALHDRLSVLFVDKLLVIMFRCIEQRDNYVARILQFSCEQTTEGRESGSLLAVAPQCSFSANLNLMRLFQIVEEEIIFDNLIVEFCRILISVYVGKPKQAFPFSPANSTLTRELAAVIPRLLDLAMSQAIISLNKLHSILITDFIPELLNEINSDYSSEAFGYSRQLHRFTMPPKTADMTFDADGVFSGFRAMGVSENSAYAVAAYCTHFNVTQELLSSKAQLSKAVGLLSETLYSFGITGVICGSSPDIVPSSSLTRYACVLSSELKSQADQLEPNLTDPLVAQLNSLLSGKFDLFDPTLNRPELNLRPREKLLAFPFYKENAFGINVHNILLKEPGKLSANSVLDMLAQVDLQFQRGLDNLMKFSSNYSIFEDFQDSLDPDCYGLLEEIIQTLIPALNLYNHVVVNLPSNNSEIPCLIQLKRLVEIFARLARVFEFMQSSLNRSLEIPLTVILQLLYALRRHSEPLNDMQKILDLVTKELECTTGTLFQLSVQCLDLITRLNSDMVQNKTIVVLCNRITSSSINNEDLAQIFSVLTHLVSSGRYEEIFSEAGLLRNILTISTLTQSSAFKANQFYFDKKLDPTHVAFCSLLELFSAILFTFKSSVTTIQFSISFLAKFQGRIDSLLGLDMQDGSDDRFEVSPAFRNLAYLREVSLVLQALSITSKESTYWKTRNTVQFNRILYLLCCRTARVFATEQPATKNSAFFKAPPALALADRMTPSSTFEESLQAIQLSEGSPTRMANPSRSVAKGTVMSSNSDMLRFKEYKQAYMNSVISTQNLFVYQVEVASIEALTYLGQTLTQMFEVADFVNLLADPSQPQFDENFFRRLSPVFVSHQLHLQIAYQKLQYYPESYKEAQLRSFMVNNTYEAYYLTNKSAHLTSEFSVRELMHIVRKSLEMFYFLQLLSFQIFENTELKNQLFFTEEFKKQKAQSRSILQDFEKIASKRENAHPQMIKESVSKLQSPHPSVNRSVAKFSRNFDAALIRDDELDSQVVTGKSLDAHAKFLDFISPLYDLR